MVLKQNYENTAWIAKARWLQLAEDSRKKFAPIAPDFVIEIRSERVAFLLSLHPCFQKDHILPLF